MSDDYQIIKKLTKYYEKIKDPTYKIGNWLVANDEIYLKYKNKLKINNIASYLFHKDEVIVVAEDKKYYYAIKYNSNFVCIRQTETEYGLVIGDYDLLAVNSEVIYQNSKPTDKNKNNPMSVIDLVKVFNWKLGKNAKEYLSYYK